MNASSRSRYSLQRSVSSKSIGLSFVGRRCGSYFNRVTAVELRDRGIVITGAGSGIGAALARRFAAEAPRKLVLADINGEAVEAVAGEVDGEAVRCDVSRPDEVRELVQRARATAGR